MLVEPKEGQLKSPILMFRVFRADGIVLSITDNGAQVPPDVVRTLAVMTEISRFKRANLISALSAERGLSI